MVCDENVGWGTLLSRPAHTVFLEWGKGKWGNLEGKRLTPFQHLSFGGCKGSFAPLPKGCVAEGNAPLSLAGGKRKRRGFQTEIRRTGKEQAE
ncbi:MAG: hypothetical protein EOM62_09920 [Bacteroidia bacterium]|nr:hypothetical protein [Bacteroidia bacterium]